MAEEDGREHRLPRSKICSICGEESESFHLNYGASSCFSCRAFFRRAIQKTREPKFECKKLLPQLGGLCNIQGRKSRKKCQKCRYELCLRAGMRPDQVLEDEAKKTRFRKLITKQLIEETDLPPTTTAPPAARSQSAPTTSFPRRRKVTLEDLPRDLIDRTKLTFKRKRAGSPPSATTPTPLPSAPCRPLGSLVDDVKILFDDSGGKGRYYGGGDPCLATGAMELINPNATLKSRGGQDSCADPSKKSPSPSINPGEIRVVPIEGLTSHKTASVAPNQSFRLNPGTSVSVDPTAKYSSLDQVDPTLSGSLSLIGPFPHTSSTSGSQIGLHPDQVPGSIDPKLALELTKSPIIPHGFEIQPGPSKPQNSDRPFCSPLPHNLLGNSCTSFPDLGISDLQQLPQDLMTLGKDLALKGLEDPHQSQPGESSKIPQSGPNQGSILVANLLGKDEEVLGASSSSNRCPDLTQEEEAQLSSLDRHYEMEAPSDALFTRFLTSHEGSHREWLLANGDSFKQSAFWRLDHIQRAWVIACKRMEIDPEFAEALLDHHTGRRENLLTKHLVKRHVLALTKVYRDFAYQQPEFTLLTTRYGFPNKPHGTNCL